MSQFEDGRLLLQDKSKFTLINNKTGEPYWENKFATNKAPEFLIDLPIMFFEGSQYKVIDAANGYVIDQSNEKTNIIGVSYFWERGFVVLEMKRNKNLHVLNINLKNPTKSWNVIVGPAKKASIDKDLRIGESPPIITADSSLVVFDKKYVTILGKEGNVVQKLNFQSTVKFVEHNQEKNILYLIEGKKRLHFIDLSVGKALNFVQLENNDVKLNILGNGSTINIVQNNEIKVLDAVSSAELGKHMFEDKIKATYIDPADNKFYALTKKTIAEINTSYGTVIRSASFPYKFNDIYEVFGKTIISGSSGASPIDLKSLNFEYPDIPNIPRVYDYVEFGDYVGYIYFRDDHFKFHVVNSSGVVVWKKSYNPTFIPSVDVVGNGLLIVSEKEVTYLDFDYGESIWSDEVKADPSFTYAVDEITNDLYMYSGKRLYKFDYSNGSLSKSQEKFKFKDFDYDFLQPQIFVLDDAIFLKGSNTIFVLNKDGTLKHEKSYKRISTGSTILEVAAIVVAAVAIGTGNANELVNVYSDGYYRQGGLVDALDISTGVAAQMKYERRLKQNRSSNFYPYVFTKLDNGNRGLIFINPSTGEERFSIEIDDKNPVYIVDDTHGVLYHMGDELLTAYDLK